MSVNDFDFLFGKWKVVNRRLKERLKQCSDWETFEADYEARPILGGMGNSDQLKVYRDGTYFEGYSLRLYQEETDTWLIYWVDNWNKKLQIPVEGKFQDDIGLFYTEEPFEDILVKVRFSWERISDIEARWSQAFSSDEGGNWETNWTMDFSKI